MYPALTPSLGGYLAIQLALSHPRHIQGVVAAYPMLDLKAPFYTECYSKPIVQVPNLPNSLIDEHLASQAKVPTVHVTAADPPDRLELAFAIVQNGRLLEFLGNKSSDLFPLERLKKLAASNQLSLPPFFIFHGKQDSAVPVDGSRRFASLLQETVPDVNVRLYIQDGDHGFDADATMETLWLREGLAMISRKWTDPLICHGSQV
jgi:acetyl esterase/lipase